MWSDTGEVFSQVNVELPDTLAAGDKVGATATFKFSGEVPGAERWFAVLWTPYDETPAGTTEEQVAAYAHTDKVELAEGADDKVTATFELVLPEAGLYALFVGYKAADGSPGLMEKFRTVKVA